MTLRKKVLNIGSVAGGARACNAAPILHNLGFNPSLLSGGEQTFAHLTSCEDDARKKNRDEMDHLLSWEVMRNNLPENAQDISDELGILNNPKVFFNLPIENVLESFKCMELFEVKKGQSIMEQGDQGDNFYIIKHGKAEVWQKGLYDNEQQNVAVLDAGDHFGEETLVTGGTRNASVRMIEDGALLMLNSDKFQELISQPILDEIDNDTALSLIENGAKILDVRYEEEFDEEHIEGVQLIPLPELRGRLSEIDPNEKYLAVCLSGKRSAVASMILKQNNIDAVSLRDGLRDWPGEMVSEY